MTGILFAAMTAAAPASAQTAATAAFRISGVSYTMPVPKGFCVPTGKAADVAQITAAADQDNVTDLSLFLCSDKDGMAADYYLLKTPKAALFAQVTREEVLASVGAEFDKPEFSDMLASGQINDRAAKAFADMTKQDTSMTGSIKPLGRDAVCAYLGGVLRMKSGTIDYTRAVSGCVTAVAGRVVMVYRYSAGDPANVLKGLADVKAMVVSITGKADN